MLNRRQFLERTLKGSSLVALTTVVPGFVASTARAATAGKDNILVVLEMTGGNDGLNTVVPYADDHYQKARPTLRLSRGQVVRIDDYVGLNPGLRSLEPLLGNGQLAVVQGVGYPNPDRSHFESMDIWQTADPRRKVGSGWLGRATGSLKIQEGHIPGIFVGSNQLPLALSGSATGTPAIDPARPYELRLGDDSRVSLEDFEKPQAPPTPTAVPDPPIPSKPPKADPHREARLRLIRDMAGPGQGADDLLQFVRRSSLQTYTTLESLRRLMETEQKDADIVPRFGQPVVSPLAGELTLIAKMIRAGFGTRIFYVAVGGFDTHAEQARQHQQLLQQVGDAVAGFFQQLEPSGDAKRVVLMTFSEFGRRLKENGSKGTDHGAASCLFVAGPAVKGGLVGQYPSLAGGDLDNGDLKYQLDFRQVYATLLGGWLGCDSRQVLCGEFAEVPLLRPPAR